jgi:hypothetical protein
MMARGQGFCAVAQGKKKFEYKIYITHKYNQRHRATLIADYSSSRTGQTK